MLRALAALVLLAGPEFIVSPGANHRETYFSVHRVGEAQQRTRGKGARAGILDHSFGLEAHPELYAGSANFLGPEGEAGLRQESHHGYWMALAFKEIAPEAEAYALQTYAQDELERARAMARAIDWAIAHKLDVLTCSGPRFGPAARAVLDPAVERAHQAGIVTAFLHYPHPGNLLPTWLGPRTGDDEREPDLNVLQYDYTVLHLGEARPYLSLSSTAPVTAGAVALVRALRPGLSPAEVKRLLLETSRPYAFEGFTAPHALDAAGAVERAVSPGKPGAARAP